jgi:pimeloyl-ACP methyl ester carboxylesterase
MGMAAETPTIVLVHGAWADATGFDAEIRALRGRGHTAIGFGNPLRDLAGDAAYLAEFLRTLSGPIVLVGHSYGGNVISTAAIGNDQVRALVYFNGWMCDVGESQQQLLEKFEGSLVGPSIRPVPFTNPDGSEGTDLYLAPEPFREAFAADVDPETAAVMAAAQRPYAAAAFAANAVGSASVDHTAVLVLARYRGQGDPTGAPALHGRACRRDDRGSTGFARLVRVPARGRDPADPAGRRGDRCSRLNSPPVRLPLCMGEELSSAERSRANERQRRQYARQAPKYDKESDSAERWLYGREHRA